MTHITNSPPRDTGAPTEAAGEGAYCNISQAAAILGVSRVSIWRWIRAGQLPAARLGHRTIRIKREDLDRLLWQIGPAGARSWVVRNPPGRATVEDSAAGERAPRSSGTAMMASEHFV